MMVRNREKARIREEAASIRFEIGESWLGLLLVGVSDRGVCAILIGDERDALRLDLRRRFLGAKLIEVDGEIEEVVSQVVQQIENPSAEVSVPLDLRGTAFQEDVWEALRGIPAGSTATYTEIAERIGRPKAVRAVASACGANALAVLVPCHRVVRRDGSLSGYRWGEERKERLLERERERGVE